METDLIIGHLVCSPLLLTFSIYYIMCQPKEINTIYGYRGKRSMKNQDVWTTANKINAKYMLQASLTAAIFQILFFFLSYDLLYSYIVLLISLGVSMWVTELKLNQLFDKEGNRLKK
jgi:uncharacterized membrane protein